MFGKVVKAVAVALFLFIVMLAAVVAVAAVFNGRTGIVTDLRKSILLTRPAAPLADDVVLKIVTFNIQDLYVAGRNRISRMKAIGEALCNLDPDIVGIQESFIEKDRQKLLDSIEGSRLVYNQYYKSGTVGCGLLVLSAYPIVETFFHRYEQNGKWYKFYHGDWWAGKGVALARIALPQGLIDFYDTHAHAAYGSTEYDGVRKFQMRSLARFILDSCLRTVPAVLVGDMNCAPGSIQYNTLVAGAHLQRLMNIDSKIDHIFGAPSDNYEYQVLETLPITGNVPGQTTPLSDHPGYMSTIRVRPTGTATSAASSAASRHVGVTPKVNLAKRVPASG
ncbi:MAG: endonuclease/exonuclease/phosphatase family protein [Candidatus Hydrogenedentes bacterium]|nr:endonuclease/exonuclease/phosphatase family protein [Candidatus Hydrogenedentota bacterium]